MLGKKRPYAEGRRGPMLGKTHTPEAKAKISAACKGKCFTGGKHTEEVKAQLSLLTKKQWESPDFQKIRSDAAKKHANSEKFREMMRTRNADPEFRQRLKDARTEQARRKREQKANV